MRSFFSKYRNLLITMLVIVLAATAFVFVRQSSADSSSQFQTALVERGNLTATIGATGTVRARQTAVLVWQVAGTVDTVNARVGDNVPEGFVLAFLEKTSLPQSIILAEADLADAQKTLDDLLNSDTARAEAVIALREAKEAFTKAENWRKELDGKIHIKEIRYKKVGNRTIPFLKEYRGYASKETIAKADENLALARAKLEDAQREYDRLTSGSRAEIAAAQARLDAARATLNLARVIAPFAGTVTEAYPLKGDQISAGATAFRLDDLSSLLVDVKVSEIDINRVSVGQPVTLTFDAILGKTYHGEVLEVSQVGSVEEGVVTFTVTVELTDADLAVEPGMTAAVNIVVEELQDMLLVPNRAVRLSDGKRVVYVLEAGQPVKREIRLGSSSDTMSVVIDGNLSEGEQIILNPPIEFGPGGPGGF
jgi:HlyD family secretion protein